MDRKHDVIEIKKAGPDDARIVASIGTVTFYEAYFEQDTPADMAEYLFESFSLDQIESEITDPNCDFYLMFRNGKAVGYAKMLRSSSAEGLTASNPIELKRIYLVERVWGTGLGEQLLNFCVDEARRGGHDTIWLGVWQENARGQSFYAKHGFRKVGTITFPYGETVGVNDVMERTV